MEFRSLAFRLSVRFDYVLFPLDLRELGERLVARQYVPTSALPSEPTVGGPEAVLGGQGVVASRGDLVVDFSSEKQFIGVAGRDSVTVRSEFAALLEDLHESVDLRKAYFYEAQARYRARLAKSPHRAIQALSDGSGILAAVSGIFGRQMTLFGVRMIDEGGGPNRPDYLEVWTQPLASSPDRDVAVSLIFRNSDYSKFTTFAGDIDKMVEHLLDMLVTTARPAKSTDRRASSRGR